MLFFSRFNMPHSPLSKLKPREFPKIGDEENAYDSYNEDTDEEPEPEPEQAEEAIPTEDEENEHDETTLISNESLNCCRIN